MVVIGDMDEGLLLQYQTGLCWQPITLNWDIEDSAPRRLGGLPPVLL